MPVILPGRFAAIQCGRMGVKDGYKLIATVYLPRGLDTVGKEMPVYAPNGDGKNERAHVNAVLTDVKRW